MIKTDRIVVLIIICLSIFLYTKTGAFIEKESVEPISAAFFPRMILISLIGTSLWVAVKSKMQPVSFPALKGVIIGSIQILLYVILIEPVGYFIVTPLFLFIFPASLGYRKWGWLAGLAVGSTLFSYAVFLKLLGVPLPMGILEYVGGL